MRKDVLEGQAESLIRAFEKSGSFVQTFDGLPYPIKDPKNKAERDVLLVRNRMEGQICNDFDSAMNLNGTFIPRERAPYLVNFVQDWKFGRRRLQGDLRQRAMSEITLQSIKIHIEDEIDKIEVDIKQKRVPKKPLLRRASVARNMLKTLNLAIDIDTASKKSKN